MTSNNNNNCETKSRKKWSKNHKTLWFWWVLFIHYLGIMFNLNMSKL